MARKIYLYTCLSRESQHQPVRRQGAALLRNRLRRVADHLLWRLWRRWTFHPWTYTDATGSNKGDISIRMAIRQLLEARAGSDTIEIREISWGELTPEAVDAINQDGDIFIIGGGAYLFFSEEGAIGKRFLDDLALILAIECPVVSFGIGISQLLKKSDKLNYALPAPEVIPLLKEFIDHCALFSVRNLSSLDFFHQAGLPAPLSVCDPALFLEPSGTVAKTPGRLRLGLNFGYHGPASNQIIRSNLIVYADALRRIHQATGCDYFYFVHYDSERLLVDLLKGLGVAVVAIDRPPDQMISWYATLDVHVCSMLHSSILSLSAAVPVLNIAYDMKNLAFFEFMKLDQYCLPALAIDADTIVERTLALIAERALIARRILRRKQELRHGIEDLTERTLQLALKRQSNRAPESSSSIA